MSRIAEVTAQIVSALESITPANGYATDIKGVYPDAEIAPDRAALPCALLTVDSDTVTEMVGVQASRERTYNIEVVFKRGATQTDLDTAHVDVLRALGFGKYPFERAVNGIITDQQSAEFEFASDGNNYTSATISVTVMYVENYG